VSSLDLALIGNGTIGVLVQADGTFCWGCFPRFDGDPAFCSLLRGTSPGPLGSFSIELVDQVHTEQEYLANTAILLTRLFDGSGGCVEITDFAPRFTQYERMFSPMTVIRMIRRVSGTPRARIRCRPMLDYGSEPMRTTFGSNHIRYYGGDAILRLTTTLPITTILEENPFFVEESETLILGPDESVPGSVTELGRHMFAETLTHWREWVRSLAIPFEWQDAVIRAAITLKLNVFEDTGAVIAAMTTSIPEAADTERNWDYRYCWIRDAYFVVNALNRLGATRTMERYLSYIMNIVADADDGRLKPMYGITGRAVPEERVAGALPGYRGMGPVRVGNQAYHQIQHDAYGSAILAAPHVFFDRRLVRREDESLLPRLENLGEQAAALFDQPDAGIWELRGSTHVHTSSAVMCWAGCDRLARIARHLGLADRASYWRGRADALHATICERAWNPQLNSFAATFDGSTLDASLLRIQDIGFVKAADPRFVGTVRAIERELRRGSFLLRYTEPDDFGVPTNAFLVCTFWYINALAAIGEKAAARELFDHVLSCRNTHGLLAEDVDPATCEPWGNFVQTYSMVGIIDSAMRLSASWDQVY
jgi:GH15 family glucan-1,4-alpha-glucosidase